MPVAGVESARKVLDPKLPANELMKRADPITSIESDNKFKPMSIIGKVDSLWRYPVKSMRGEELDETFAGYPGVYGDRVFAFKSSASPTGFPYFTAREQRRLLQYRPRFRYPDKAARPVNLTEADKMGAGPLSADISELMVDIETPEEKRSRSMIRF